MHMPPAASHKLAALRQLRGAFGRSEHAVLVVATNPRVLCGREHITVRLIADVRRCADPAGVRQPILLVVTQEFVGAQIEELLSLRKERPLFFEESFDSGEVDHQFIALHSIAGNA